MALTESQLKQRMSKIYKAHERLEGLTEERLKVRVVYSFYRGTFDHKTMEEIARGLAPWSATDPHFKK